MVRFAVFFALLPLFLSCSASPIAKEPGLASFLDANRRQANTASPSNLDRRERRHLRLDDLRARADPIDNGGIANFSSGAPVPVRGKNGLPFFHKSNTAIDKENIDNISPPTSDAGTVPNLKWSMSLSHAKLLQGGWVREQTVTDLPPSKDFSAAELSLSPNAYFELHWHRVAEWAFVLNGTGRISAVDENGKNYISDISGPTNGNYEDGSIWYFPPGVSHSIQALDTGIEFLVLFADGNFDGLGTTFMLSDWLARTPKDIVAQNFAVNISVFDNIPQKDPYFLEAAVPPPQLGQAAKQAVKSPMGRVENPFSFDLGKQNKTEAPGGWYKIQDSATNFPTSIATASALVYVQPGALRELHWHRDDEWLYIVSGYARITAFAGSSSSRTFDFQVGDTGVFPVGYGHYVKNMSPTEPLIYLEIFKAPKFADF